MGLFLGRPLSLPMDLEKQPANRANGGPMKQFFGFLLSMPIVPTNETIRLRVKSLTPSILGPLRLCPALTTDVRKSSSRSAQKRRRRAYIALAGHRSFSRSSAPRAAWIAFEGVAFD